MERIKSESNFLRGRIAEELAQPTDHFTDPTVQLLKSFGIYQQDDRDRRRQLGDPCRKSMKVYQFMVRTAVPGGRLTSGQLLAQLDLCEEQGDRTLRITGRQNLELHGVEKPALRAVLRRIHESGLTTKAASGDVRRNVTCCPAPFRGDPVHGEMQDLAQRLSDELAPHMAAYDEIWLAAAPASTPADPTEAEPLYGKTFLPRKFKVAIGLPGDNCVDLYAQDVGLMTICRDFHVVGYNVLVGGGMGMTPARATTFPALAQRMAFAYPGHVVDVVKAIMTVYRDHGDRTDRRRARLKYLVADWGVERFKAEVEKVLGYVLEAPQPDDVWDIDDHLGWREQGDGRWFYGLHVESGRIADRNSVRLKTALGEICRKHQLAVRLTPGQSLLLSDIQWEDRLGIEDLLRRHGVKLENEISNIRRWSNACVGLPNCSQAVTESERALPGVIDQLEIDLARLGLAKEVLSLRMTGCTNGCSRPFNVDVGIVGRTAGRYAIYLGGRRTGDRLGFLYRDGVPLEQLVETLTPVLAYFKLFRSEGESFGDFCFRKGRDDLLQNISVV